MFNKYAYCFLGLSMVAGSASALNVTQMTSAQNLVGNILGAGITTSNISYTGATRASGTFTGGRSSGLTIYSGILLTSGRATNAIGPNTQNERTYRNRLSGDTDLDGLIPASTTTLDATVLEFDFVTTGGNIFFNYQFASDEYNEFVGTGFNDVFGFILDGSNIAFIPGTTTPVAIDNVNNTTNSHLYNDNDRSLNPIPFNIEYDGFTNVFTATALNLAAGTHHIKLAIADVQDDSVDSAIFIQAGSFSNTPVNPVPIPAAVWLFGSALLGLVGVARRRTQA